MGAKDALISLCERIQQRQDPHGLPDLVDRLSLYRSSDRWSVDFYGDPFGESYVDLLQTLADAAPEVGAISLAGPDVGCNGTRNWDLSILSESKRCFEQLRSFNVEGNRRGFHNRTFVGADYAEDGQIGSLLQRAPALIELRVPSAPSQNFFIGAAHPMQFLAVDAGYDHQDFILNLANSSRFWSLQQFEFGEYCEHYVENSADLVTPAAHYRMLFASRAFSSVKRFMWKDPQLSRDELREFAAITQHRSVLISSSNDWYLSEFDREADSN